MCNPYVSLYIDIFGVNNNECGGFTYFNTGQCFTDTDAPTLKLHNFSVAMWDYAYKSAMAIHLENF